MLFNRYLKKIAHEYYRLRAYIGRPRTIIQKEIVSLKPSTTVNRPIFLIGLHRSGTSLLRRIVNSHSNISCPPESFFLKHIVSMINDKGTFAGLKGMGLGDNDKILEEIRNWSGYFHSLSCTASGKTRWADKTPQYIEILPDLDKLFGDTAQYIMIFRHPLDVIYSNYSRGWRHGNYDDDLLLNTAHYVSDYLDKQLIFLNSHRNKCFNVYYEELIMQPEKTLRSMFEFLNEKWEPEVMQYHNYNHGFGTEDPIVRGAAGFQKNFGNWKCFKKDQLDKILPIINKKMKMLGYSVEKHEPKLERI